MDNSRENPHSFTAFSSAAQDAAQQRQEAALVAAQTNRGQGGANARVWTCDFSFDYVKINAEYRT